GPGAGTSALPRGTGLRRCAMSLSTELRRAEGRVIIQGPARIPGGGAPETGGGRGRSNLRRGALGMPPGGGGRSSGRPRAPPGLQCRRAGDQDRKSTRLNSSHVKISYAVFCLKKKKNKQ